MLFGKFISFKKYFIIYFFSIILMLISFVFDIYLSQIISINLNSFENKTLYINLYKNNEKFNLLESDTYYSLSTLNFSDKTIELDVNYGDNDVKSDNSQYIIYTSNDKLLNEKSVIFNGIKIYFIYSNNVNNFCNNKLSLYLFEKGYSDQIVVKRTYLSYNDANKDLEKLSENDYDAFKLNDNKFEINSYERLESFLLVIKKLIFMASITIIISIPAQAILSHNKLIKILKNIGYTNHTILAKYIIDNTFILSLLYIVLFVNYFLIKITLPYLMFLSINCLISIILATFIFSNLSILFFGKLIYRKVR